MLLGNFFPKALGIFIFLGHALVSGTPTLQSTLQIPAAGSGGQAINRFVLSGGTADGQLSADNQRRFHILGDAFAADGSKSVIEADVTYGDVLEFFDKFYIGDIPKVLFNKVLPNCIPRILPQEKPTQVYLDQVLQFAKRDGNALGQQTRAASPPDGDTVHGPQRRLLQQIQGVQDEGEGNQVFNLSALDAAVGSKVGLEQRIATADNILGRTDVIIQNAFNDLRTFQTANALSQSILENTLHLIPILNNSFQGLAVVLDREAHNFLANIQSLNTTVQAVLQDAQEMAAQNLERLDYEYNQTTTNVRVMAQVVRDMTMENTNITLEQLQFLAALNSSIETVKALLSSFHESRERYIQRARYFAAGMDELRLDSPLRRSGAAQLSQVKQNARQASAGTILALTSVERPALDPLGFVPVRPGENRFFVGQTFVYSTVVNPSSLSPPIDTDIEALDPLTNELDFQRLQAYTTIVGSGPTVFIHARRIYLYCNNDFLLSNRSLWYTAYDLMKFLGPGGCTPFASCDCWAVIERERCSAAGNVPYLVNQTFPSLLSSGLCRDPTELDQWFSGGNIAGIDRSIAHEQAAENVTSEADLNAELSRMCRQTLVTGTDYKLHSSFFPGANTNNLIYHVPNLPAQCSTNQGSMQTQSNLLGFFTLPNQFYALATLATQSLFHNVSTRFEAQKYGTEDRDVTRQNQPFVVTGPPSTPAADLAAFLELAARGQTVTEADAAAAGIADAAAVLNCDLQVPAFASTVSVPLYLLVRNRVEQTVNVTLTDARGNRLVQTLNDVVQTNTLQTLLPDQFFVAGYLDCWLLPCDDGTGSLDQTRYVYDTFQGSLSGDRRGSHRWHHPDAFIEFAVNLTTILQGTTGGFSAADQLRNAPFAPDSDFLHNHPTFSVDAFNRQEEQLFLDSTHLTDGLQNHIIPLVPNSANAALAAAAGLNAGGWICDPVAVAKRGVGSGQICTLLSQYQPELPANSFGLFPNLDQQPQVAFRRLVSSFEVVFDLPALTVTETEARAIRCPDPNFIDVQTAPTAVAGSPVANLAQLTFINTHRVPLLVVVEVADTQGNLACHFRTDPPLRVGVNATQAVALLPLTSCSDVQRITIETIDQHDGFVADCWFRTLNLTAVFEQRDALVLAQDPSARSTGGIEGAVANFDLGSVSRLEALQERLVTDVSIGTAQIALTGVAALNNQWDAAEAVAQRMVDQLAWQEANLITGPIQLNQTAQAAVAAQLVQFQNNNDAFLLSLDTQAAAVKDRFAQVRLEQDATRQNLSRLVAQLQQLGNANQQYQQSVAAERSQRANFTATVNAQYNTIKGIAEEASVKVEQLARLNDISFGATTFTPGDTPAASINYWFVTESVGLDLLGALNSLIRGAASLIPGCDVFEVVPGRIPKALTRTCEIALNLVDNLLDGFEDCGLPFAFVCNLLDWLTRALIPILIIVGVIVGVCLYIQLKKK